MNILYIHGLDSKPNLQKMELVEARGHAVFALHIDYRKDKAAYWKLKNLALEAKVEYIIGSSLGGYFGYWLGQELCLPQLLFNPAMPFRSIQVPVSKIEEGNPKLAKSWVALGEHDDIIPANLNKEFFEQRENARVVLCSWLGHQIDLETFEEMVRWAGI